MNANMNEAQRLIIGLGLTGLSVARWCARHNLAFDLCDTRSNLNTLDLIKEEFSTSAIYLGELELALLQQYDELIVSPGIAIAHPAIQQAMDAGVRVRGDVDLFAESCKKPIVAITGSNGKSTVTSLVGELLGAAGVDVAIGGNIGLPVLDMPTAEVYVLELSSFQLETTEKLAPKVALVLNISEDHLDRYAGMQEYIAAKHKVFAQAERIIVNRQDQQTFPKERGWTTSFGLDLANDDEFGVLEENGVLYLCEGQQKLIASDQLKVKGRHNIANILAALAVLQQLEVDLEKPLPSLETFTGLPHRCQWLGEKNGVTFYNDSKGTNVGSTVAAITGLGPEFPGKILLLAGGEGKGQDFSPLAEACKNYIAEVIGFGKDAELIGHAVKQSCAFSKHNDLREAFARGLALAKEGDVVLLSPACASLDQFKDYIQRGTLFTELVEEVL